MSALLINFLSFLGGCVIGQISWIVYSNYKEDQRIDKIVDEYNRAKERSWQNIDDE